MSTHGYICKYCNLYNDILNISCKDCNACRPLAYDSASIWIRYRRGLDDLREWTERMSDNSKVDKFMQFFNSGKILYSSMSFDKRREWREELAEILMTARANLSAADTVDREESARLTPEGRQWLESNTEDSQLLNAPRVRKERQTKADKLREQMTSLGLDLNDVKSIMSNVEKNAKDKDINNLTFKKSEPKLPIVSELCRIGEHVVCTGSFRDGKDSHSCNCDCHRSVSVSGDTRDNPSGNNPAVFDASQLKFS